MSSSQSAIDHFTAQIQEEFDTNEPAPIDKFLGMQVSQHEDCTQASVCMREYIEKMWIKHKGKEAKYSTPISTIAEFDVDESHPESRILTGSELQLYQSLVGSIRYLCIARPDIFLAARRVSQFNAAPQEYHLNLARRILSYVHNTKEATINYGTGPGAERTMNLEAYSDASFCSGNEKGRSVQGHLVMYAGGPIDWYSKQIRTANKSTTDSELIALHRAVAAVKRHRLLLDELGFPEKGPSIIYEDNKGAIDTINSKSVYKGESYVVKKVRYLDDQFKGPELSLQQVGTDDQLADQFTKPMGRDKHYELNERIGCHLPYKESGGVLKENPSPRGE